MIDRVSNENGGHTVRNGLVGSEAKHKMPENRQMRLRKARVIQSVNMPQPDERAVSFVIDTGEVFAVP